MGQIVYRGPVIAPVTPGTEIGRLRVDRGDVRALEIPVYAAEAVGAGPLGKRATDAAVELSAGWFRKALGRTAPP